eukprot:jgi/Bigna1/131039/aug1.13_g5747
MSSWKYSGVQSILLRSGLSNHKVPPKILVDKIATKVFGAFDRNQDGFVDNRELLAGLSILLGSYRSEPEAEKNLLLVRSGWRWEHLP